MFIKNNEIVIRSATMEDAEILTAWWNDGAVMAHAGFPNGLGQSIEETRTQIQLNEIKLSQLCIIEIEERCIGELSYRIGLDFAEIGIKICNEVNQGQGYGTAILKMLIQFLFTDEVLNRDGKIEKIQLDTNSNNVRAQHVYEKLGFKKVATNINAFKNQLGEWQTSIDYEMTLEDYQNTF